ncbi:hypothetical protein VNO80_23251 [Phaseolus coccineus]|uniref:Uncharacterized protein n=1 Tax=Phaseolus coccineus TaxID=3886 RepID=A0AAN9M779_PHACN
MSRFVKTLLSVEDEQEKEKKEVNQVDEFEGRTKKKAFGSGWCLEKGQKGEELWEVRLDSDLDFSERVLTRDKGNAMLGVLKVQMEFRREEDHH